MTDPLAIYGRVPDKTGRHFMMSNRARSDGPLYFAVWIVTRRDRSGDGAATKVAEFASKRAANEWMRMRNARKQP